MITTLRQVIFAGAIFGSFVSQAKPDTLALYEIGEVRRIEGLSYGNRHSLVLYTDSTFTYSVLAAGQISVMYDVFATGRWTQKDDLFTFTDTSLQKPEFYYNSCTADPERKNLRLIFNFGRYFTCFDLPPLTVYYKDSVVVSQLQIGEQSRGEKEAQIKKYVPYLRAELELSFISCDSINMFGITVVPGEPTCNQFGFSCNPPFVLNLVQQGTDLKVIEHLEGVDYIFERVR